MKILVVQESDWIEKGPHQSHHLMERMSQRGHEVRVIDYEIEWKRHDHNGIFSPRHASYGVKKTLMDGSVTVIRPSFLKAPLLDYLSVLVTHRVEIERQLNSFKPDVVIGFGLLNASIAVHLANRRSLPFIYYIIDELHRLVQEDILQGVAQRVESRNLRSATKVLSINEGLREYTVSMGASPLNSLIIGAGVDRERFRKADGSAVREELGISDDDRVLFFMGWLHSFSGLDDVALELSKTSHDDVKLLVLGKGDLWWKLQAIRLEKHLEDRLFLIDWKPYNQVPEYVAAADVCLLPSQRNEIMRNIVPIKMYEYLAAGKAVVATGLPGLMREFGWGNGVVYLDEPKEAVERSLELMEGGEARREGERGSEFVKDRSWSKVTDQFERLLVQVTS